MHGWHFETQPNSSSRWLSRRVASDALARASRGGSWTTQALEACYRCGIREFMAQPHGRRLEQDSASTSEGISERARHTIVSNIPSGHRPAIWLSKIVGSATDMSHPARDKSRGPGRFDRHEAKACHTSLALARRNAPRFSPPDRDVRLADCGE